MRALKTVVLTLFLLMTSCICCSWLPNVDPERWLDPLLSLVEPTPEEPPVTPQLTRQPLPPEAQETERLLEETLIPVRDLHELAIRLRGVPPDIPRTVNPEGAPDYSLGTCRTFHASNVDTDEQFEVRACLRYKNDVLYMWVEDGVKVDEAELKAAADLFARKTYPTNRAFFGTAPVKEKRGYVKFLPPWGPVNLALSEGGGPGAGPVDHLGVQVESTAEVMAQLARIKAAGLPVREEMGVNCCHANQDKFWVQDPDGVEWEVYHLNYDLEEETAAPLRPAGLALAKSKACCAP